MPKVLITDYAWPDTSEEQRILEAAGHTVVAGPSTPLPEAQIDALIQEHQPDAIMTCWAEVSAKAVQSSPGLKVVARLGVGLDNIAVQTCTERGVWVTNVPDYCMEEVSDQAIALLLDWTRGVAFFDAEVKAGRWDPAGARLRRLANLTIGIVGFGRIARYTVKKLQAWGCRILVYDVATVSAEGVEQVPLDALLAQSDAVVIHAPLLPSTHHMFNAETIGKMKSGALLINVSRGPVVDTAALEAALNSGHLSGAGLDVVEGEPNPPASLVGLKQVTVTPHVAFSSDASLIELRRSAAQCVVSALAGETPPKNACNKVG
jgi:D-3-phosphoglycerate dehydrogenase